MSAPRADGAQREGRCPPVAGRGWHTWVHGPRPLCSGRDRPPWPGQGDPAGERRAPSGILDAGHLQHPSGRRRLGTPFDVVAAVPGPRRRRAGHAGVVGARRRRAQHRHHGGRRLGYAVVAEVGLAHGRLFGPHPTSSTRWGPPHRSLATAPSDSTRSAGGSSGESTESSSVRGPGSWPCCRGCPVRGRTVIPSESCAAMRPAGSSSAATVELDGGDLPCSAPTCPTSPTAHMPSTGLLSDLLPPPTEAAVLAGDMNLWGPPVNSYLRGWRRAVDRPDLAGPPAPQPARPRPGHSAGVGARRPGRGRSPDPTTSRWWSPWAWPEAGSPGRGCGVASIRGRTHWQGSNGPPSPPTGRSGPSTGPARGRRSS